MVLFTRNTLGFSQNFAKTPVLMANIDKTTVIITGIKADSILFHESKLQMVKSYTYLGQDFEERYVEFKLILDACKIRITRVLSLHDIKLIVLRARSKSETPYSIILAKHDCYFVRVK